jgi:diguanylate cyclase (GGDEF)-like protein
MRARILRSNQELVDALGTIQDMATHDSLTGLRNRASIGDALEHAVSKGRRTGESHAVLFIDLDGFKPVNDTLGHAAGDHLLREIARRLRLRVRESDLVARLGGDEFVVMVDPVSDRQGLRALAAKILAVIGEPVALHGGDVTVTASIGIAVFPDDGNEATTLLANADIAMYRAKELGRNRICEYTPDLGENLVERFELERGMRDALRNGEFALHYQPKIEFTSGQMLGVEALIRWQHPQLGLVGPDRFVPIAEANNFIVPLGRWVIEQACRQAGAWRQAGLPRIPIAVNLSVNQLADPALVDFVATTLRATGADPTMIEFEITETALMSNMADTVPMLEALRGLGVRLAVDDFGTGYSSLCYLKELPVDVLKIDRAFVRHLPHSRDDLAITRAVIAMAHALSMKVVAEGVEVQPQFDSLHAEGCDQFQGFYCRPALPGNELEELVRRYGLAIPTGE